MNAIAEIFRAGGAEPSEAPEAGALIANVERRTGGPLPDAFRQFLSLANGEELLGHFSNCDQPIPFAELGRRFRVDWGSYDPLEHRILPFMIENQGVCTWALPLDEGDDPRVLVEVDSGTPPQWQTAAESFTLWLECQVQDRAPPSIGVLGAQAPELDDGGLALLRSSFKQGPTTYAWPGRQNYRFSNACMELVLWNADGQCDWWISLLPGARFGEALDRLRGIPGLMEAIYALDDEHRALLSEWKAGLATA